MFGDKYHYCLEQWAELLGTLEPEERERRIANYEASISWGKNQNWPQKGPSSSQRSAIEILEKVISKAREISGS